MPADIIEQTIGKFGKYQLIVTILIILGQIPSQLQLYNVVFILPSVDFVCLDGNLNLTNHCPCERPLYDDSTILSSVTSEWNLICGRTALASLAQSMLQVGILPGSLIYGYISDRNGRKLAVNLSLLSSAIFVSLSGVLTSYWMFMITRFLIGTSVGGTMLCCYVMLVELYGSSFRNNVILVDGLSNCLGYFFLPIIAYYLRDWRNLQLACGAPWLFMVVYFWIIPESPRWLITVGRRKEAIQVLTNIAKRNGLPLENIEKIVNEVENKTKTDEEVLQHGSYMDLFKTSKIRLYTIMNALVWMFCSHTYYGVNQYIGRLQGNLYLNVMLSGLCLIPGVVLVFVSILHLKRRISVALSLLMAAISLLAFLAVPSNSQSVTLPLSLISLIGTYSAFLQLYLFSSEIFPTIIRNSGLGFCSMSARVGSFIAPFVINIGIEWVTISVFSGLAFVAALFCYFLPETKGIVLLNTVEQSENVRVSQKISHVRQKTDGC